MTISPKTLLKITTVSILMAGASAAHAQEAETVMPAPEETVVEETVETIETTDTLKVEIFETESEATPEMTKVVEDVSETDDALEIEASSETVIPAEEIAVETEEEAAEEAATGALRH